MARCRKILANGKRCKAAAISGTKYCLFHTTGKGMRRSSGGKKNAKMDGSKVKNVARRTTENQIAVRGSKKLAASTVAYGAYMQTRPDYRVTTKQHAARYNRQGRVIVGAHEQRTIEFTTSEGGRNFQKSDGSTKRRVKMGKTIVHGGRLIPVLGYGYVVHNTLSGGQQQGDPLLERTAQGATLMAVGETVSHYKSGGSTVGLLTGGKYTPSSLLERFI